MITYYFKSVRSEQLQTLKAYKPGCWVNVEAPTEQEINQLAKKFDLTAGHLQDALDEDEMPRLEKEGEQSYIFVRSAYKERGELVTAPLLFVFSGDMLITVSQERLPAIDTFITGKVAFATTQRAKLVLLILRHIVDQYDGYITRTSKKIKVIRSRLRGHEIRNKDFVDFVMIEDELNEFLSALTPTNAILRRLLMGRYVPLFAEDQDIVEDLLLNNEQSIEACNSNMQSITHIREAYTSISSNNLNRTIKVLTILTVLIMLPSMIYGMYGMNIALPFKDEVWVFGAIIAFTILINLLVVFVARKRQIF